MKEIRCADSATNTSARSSAASAVDAIIDARNEVGFKMKARELIEFLQTQDPEAEVMRFDDDVWNQLIPVAPAPAPDLKRAVAVRQAPVVLLT